MANLAGVTPEKAIKLAVNDYARACFADNLHKPPNELPPAYGMLAGAAAGLCQVVATNPMEMVKIQMQLAAKTGRPIPKTVDVVKRLGLRGIYTGTTITLMRDIPFSVLFFQGYAMLKEQLDSSFLAGCLAACVASAAATPMDVIKTRYQSTPNASIALIVREAWTKEGPRAFFKGTLPRCMTVSPLFGISLAMYDLQQRWLRQNR